MEQFLGRAERRNGRFQGRPAACLVAVIGYRDSANGMFGTPFDDDAYAMTRHRTDALVSDAGDGNAIDREPGRTDADDLAPMRGRVVEANDVRHA